jgi:hypothetical protein
MDASVARVLSEVPFTADDLPGYAGRLFDFLVANPQQLRLATWHRLERAGTGHEPHGLSDSVALKTSALSKAQADGQLTDAMTAEDLYAFTLALTSAWLPASPHAPATLSPEQLATHRRAAIEAVRRLTAVGDSPEGRMS